MSPQVQAKRRQTSVSDSLRARLVRRPWSAVIAERARRPAQLALRLLRPPKLGWGEPHKLQPRQTAAAIGSEARMGIGFPAASRPKPRPVSDLRALQDTAPSLFPGPPTSSPTGPKPGSTFHHHPTNQQLQIPYYQWLTNGCLWVGPNAALTNG